MEHEDIQKQDDFLEIEEKLIGDDIKKHKKEMPVSGKSVFRIKDIRDKK